MRSRAHRLRHRWDLALVAGALVAGVACAAVPSSAPRSRFRRDLTGLERRRDGFLDEVYRRPGADLGRYAALIVDPVTLAPDLDTGDDSYRESDLALVRRVFRERVVRAVERQTPIARAPGADVLRLRITLTGLASNRPPLDRSGTGDQILSTARGVGAAAMQLELRDSLSDELLFAAVDRYQGWEISQNFYTRTTWGDAKHAFERWGEILRRRLEQWRGARSAGLDR